jgi:hypothetical protein
MSKYFNLFVTNLFDFMKALNRYVPDDKFQEFLDIPVDKLDFNMLIVRYLNKTRPIKVELKAGDHSIFEKPLVIFPEIDISEYWGRLKSGQKNKVLIYMQLLHVQAELIIGGEEEAEFNPFLGLGVNEDEFTLNSMKEGIEGMVDTEVTAPGLETMLNFAGLEKHLNVDEILNKLNSMTSDDIDETTKTLSSIFNGNDKMKQFIGDVLNNVKTEIGENKKTEGNKISDIFKMAQNVGEKINPNITKDDINFGDVMKNLKEMNGGEGLADNPLGDKLEGLMKMMTGIMGGKQPSKAEMDKMVKEVGMNPNMMMGMNPAAAKNPHNKKYVPKKRK